MIWKIVHSTFFDYIINIKSLGLNKIKKDEWVIQNTFIYYIGYVNVKNLSYIKVISVSPLYLIINKINGYIEKSNGNKYASYYWWKLRNTKNVWRTMENNQGSY